MAVDDPDRISWQITWPASVRWPSDSPPRIEARQSQIDHVFVPSPWVLPGQWLGCGRCGAAEETHEEAGFTRSHVKDLDYSSRDYSEEARQARIAAVHAEYEHSQRDGTYGHAFTAEELDAARAQVQAEGIRPDPVAEILDEPQAPLGRSRRARDAFDQLKRRDPAQEILDSVDEELRQDEMTRSVAEFSSAFFVLTREMLDDQQQLVAGFDKKLNDLLYQHLVGGGVNHAFISIGIDPAEPIKDLGVWRVTKPSASRKAAQREKVRELQLRRHGTAYICPRHGESPGGLCRKCVVMNTGY